MNTEENLNLNTENKLPAFLKVICILTFIGSGLAIFSNVFALFALKTTHAFNVAIMEAAAKSGEMLDPETMFFNSKVTIISGIISSIGCLVGAILMWKLKKVGYYVYLISQICSIVFPFVFPIIPGTSLMTILSLIFPIGFIVMYSVNLKHLS